MGDSTPSSGPAAELARAEFREIVARKGHAVDNAREAAARLQRAFDEGALQRSPFVDQALDDLHAALATDEDDRVGGKAAEAARFILRAVDRMLDGL